MNIHAHPFRVLLALLLVGGMIYGGSLDNSFHYDDEHSIVRNPHLRSLANIPAFFVDPTLFSSEPGKAMYRPALLCTYALNYALDGYDVRGYHLFNLGIHILTAWLVFWLGCRVSGPRAGWFGALLFLVHPLAVEPVNYISSRSESLAALWYLLSLNLYLRGRLAGGLVAYGAGLLTKTTAITLPLVLLCFEIWGGNRRGVDWRLTVRRMAPYLLISLVYLIVSQGLIQQAFGPEQVRSLTAQGLTQLKALVYYLKLLLLPFPLSVEHAFQVSRTVEWVHLPALGLVISLLVVSRHALSRKPLLLFAAMLLPLLPASLVPLNVLVNEHRLYLPMAFACLGLGGLWSWSRLDVGGSGRVLLLGLVGVWGWWGAQRTRDWQDEYTLWTRALKVAPQMPRVHFLLGEAHRRRGALQEAVEAYVRADSLYGGNADVQVSLGALYYEMGQLDRSRAVLEHLLRTQPEHPEALYNLGLVLRAEDGEAALRALERAFALRPDFVEAGMELARAREDRGDLEEALQVLQEIVQKQPSRTDAWVNLGRVEAGMGRYVRARKAWEQALQLDPIHPQARANLEKLRRLKK